MQMLVLIEKKRAELIEVVKTKGIRSCETLTCSKELDDLIMKYQREIMEQNRGITKTSTLFKK